MVRFGTRLAPNKKLILNHLDKETELGEEVSGDSLGDDVVILNVGTWNLLVYVVDDLFHGI